MADAAIEEHHPILFGDLRQKVDRGGIGQLGLVKAAFPPQHVAQRELDRKQIAVTARQGLQRLDRRIGVALRPQRLGPADFGRHEMRGIGGKAAIGFCGQLRLAQRLQHVTRQQKRIGMVRAQIGRNAQVQQGIARLGIVA